MIESATRRVVLLTIPSLVVLLSNASRAQPQPSAIVKAARQLAQLFGQFLRPFEEIGTVAARQNLLDALTRLNHDLFEVEQEKRFLVLALRRRPLVQTELQLSAVSLASKINRLRDSLQDIAPRLRVAYRSDADATIELLAQAVVDRKEFVTSLGSVNSANADASARDAQAAIRALSQAQQSLANAIAALQRV